MLGVNGAGKTTTFKCLVADEVKSDGQIFIGGRNITDYYGAPELMSSLIGYCPQINPIDDELTVKEKLILLGQLKGLDE